jgi:glutaminase
MVKQEEEVAQEENMMEEENEALANLLLQLGDIDEPQLVEEVNKIPG